MVASQSIAGVSQGSTLAQQVSNDLGSFERDAVEPSASLPFQAPSFQRPATR
jgi:hypothetical protein